MTISVVTVYHSGYGHTSVVAGGSRWRRPAEGVEATLIEASTLNYRMLRALQPRQCGRYDLWFSDVYGLGLRGV